VPLAVLIVIRGLSKTDKNESMKYFQFHLMRVIDIF
jgi:hypothetical protein